MHFTEAKRSAIWETVAKLRGKKKSLISEHNRWNMSRVSQSNDHCLCVCVTLQRGLLIRYSSRKCLAILAVLSCWDLVSR